MNFARRDSSSFAKDITIYDSSLYMTSLNVEFLFTNFPLNKTIINCVSDMHNKNLYDGRLSKRELLVTASCESSFVFITSFINKLTEWQWVLLWIPPCKCLFMPLWKKKKKWFDNCPIHFKPVIKKTYVDHNFVFLHLKNTSNFLWIIWTNSINV